MVGSLRRESFSFSFLADLVLRGHVSLVLLHSKTVGHTYNLADLVAAILSSLLKDKDVYSPKHLVKLIDGAKSNENNYGEVKILTTYITHEFFLDVQGPFFPFFLLSVW